MFDHVWPIFKDVEKWADVLPTPKSPEASYSVDLNANDDQAHVDMQTNSSSSSTTGRKKEKTRKKLEVEKTYLLPKMYEGNNEIIEIFKRGEKR